MHDQRKSHLKFGKKSGKITMYAMMNKSYFNNISEHIGCPNKFKRPSLPSNQITYVSFVLKHVSFLLFYNNDDALHTDLIIDL